MLAPMPLASTLGIAGPAKPMVTGCVLSLNGNAITVSTQLFTRMAELDSAAVAQRPCTAQALKAVIEEDRRSGLPPLTFASVFLSPPQLPTAILARFRRHRSGQ